MEKVSVIIPCYNLGTYLEACLGSIFEQTFKDFAIIIVNDGSTDKTEQIVKNYIINNPDKKTFIKYIYQNNKGLAGARNTGIKNSKSEFIAFLDADDILTKHSLETRIKTFEHDISVGLVYGDAFLYKNGKVLKGTYKDKLRKTYEGNVYPDIFRENFIIMPTVMVRKKVFDRCGIFNEALDRAEDYEMWIRIAKEGWKFRFINSPISYYTIRENSLSDDTNRTEIALIKIYENSLRNCEMKSAEEAIVLESLRNSKIKYNLKEAHLCIRKKHYESAKKHLEKIIDCNYKKLKFSFILQFLKLAPNILRTLYILNNSKKFMSFFKLGFQG